MNGSNAEISTYIKQIQEELKNLQISGGGGVTITEQIYIDHVFFPSIEVTDTQKVINFDKPVYAIKITANDCDVYVNFDREITSSEYTIIYAKATKIISRKTSSIYFKTPSGLVGTVSIEALILTTITGQQYVQLLAYDSSTGEYVTVSGYDGGKTLVYDSNGNITEIDWTLIDSNGNAQTIKRTYSYDSDGNLTNISAWNLA